MHLRDRFAVKICEITVLVTKLSWSFEITLLETGASHKCTANYGFDLKIGTGRVATAPLLWFVLKIGTGCVAVARTGYFRSQE